ncbi:ATP-binding protein [Flavobacterium cupreum]|uniref:AAA family ATPase n=3 Tax=Flavobacterium TaxID=237 RepID=A0A940XD64_9FLAO|nr:MULTISPECIES: AAA family ATPase [Flavobacterium]MBP4139791.1 AAA family ATPase [Flavobacterium geliluteum]RUT67716.1 ATP-binding protein [Flavobacterium cupreum]TCN49918.1 AAA domain-containing protein [Flavobacterium circumlabens]TDO68878.1 AAA domain-containing protein [Flavobacterium sp. P3160]TEB41697.1 ATP-binding protein [Flavobacterium circumlabens]
MLIKKIHVEKFRGFNNIEFELGTSITVIAGQNGTQKTTLLGLLSQPFSINDKSNPISDEKPLCGGNYKSSFSEKFKLSKTFDKPKHHTWTLETNGNESFSVESIARDKDSIRFWKQGDRTKGSGYLNYPVIYLSLSRLMPIGEDDKLDTDSAIQLTAEELLFYNKWHNTILIINNLEISSVDYLSSKQKNTLGVSTDHYDWKMNSSGQDNLGKILLAILSFKRLKEKFPTLYEYGILVIDEIDTTLYPASQIKLIEALRKFSSDYKIQIIFTTHSLTILEKVCGIQNDIKLKNQVKVVFLQKIDKEIVVNDSATIDFIRNKLNVSLSSHVIKTNKVPLFTEDKEAEIFLKNILKSKKSSLNFIQCTLGCNNYIELVRKKIKGFNYPESIICLDGDVNQKPAMMKEITKHKNFLILPGNDSPEKILAEMLYVEPDSSIIWDKLFAGYDKQICFKDYSIADIRTHREKAKLWFNDQKQYWGLGCNKLINIWIGKNVEETKMFLQTFDSLISKYGK